MSLLSKLLGNRKPPHLSSPDSSVVLSGHEAIQRARTGQLPIPEMLDILVKSSLFVPLGAPSQMDGDVILAWEPCTVSKADGSQWVVAFTKSDLASEFCKREPSYSHGLSVEAPWLLQALPAEHGIVINIGTEQGFEWDAGGITKYKSRASQSAP